MKRSILIVDDEKSIRNALSGVLDDEGFHVCSASDGMEAIRKVERENPDLVLLDIWMEGMDGIEVLKKLKAISPNLLIIMISGHGTIETAVKATKLGAYDFIEKPLSLDKVVLTINRALNFQQLEKENEILRNKIHKNYKIIGNSDVVVKLKQQIEIAAPTNGWILITGENGTGKELVARSIHRKSLRSDKPFVEVNSAAIPEELIESELFGYEKGAFTGAVSQKKGKFDMANGGTIFLDEIADMSLKTQAKILRILQEQEYERVGGTKSIHVDVRVIAATNRDLKEEMERGNFREDLYYRLNVIPLEVPPLRKRKEDIPVLVSQFLKEFCAENHKEQKALSKEALDMLTEYNWPGNVRELKNIVEMLVIMTPEVVVSAGDIPVSIRRELNEEKKENLYEYDSLKAAREEFEKQFIIEKLKEFDDNVSKTALAIGVERSHLHRKIKNLGIEMEK
ncbi:MAG: sigma-54 dependent transcriptional regulator [Thermodesulfobacteriota bacterium]|nr:sigma-54 dependent transcriptional regulator [Thermodesulfobacteriota bacterium]